MDESEKEAQSKGLQLAARLEHLAQTDASFRAWLQVGIDQIERGEYTVMDDCTEEEEVKWDVFFANPQVQSEIEQLDSLAGEQFKLRLMREE